MAAEDGQEPVTELLVTPETWPYIVGTPRHKALSAWLAENDIKTTDVSVDEPLSIITAPDGTQTIHYTAHLRNAGGHKFVDPERQNRPASEARSTPLKTRPPRPKLSDITTLALLTAIEDHQRAFKASTGWASIRMLTPWRTLSTVYPEKVVAAAYTREATRGHLEYGACPCLRKCDLCLRNGKAAWLTDEGLTKLAELRAKGTG